MAIQQEIGARGEEMAVNYLLGIGYKILEKNWRYKRAEIDVIAMHDETLVFVEVKTRSYDYFGPPDAFVDNKKEELMTGASHVYMEMINHEWEVRFDVISILLNRDGTGHLKHIKSAFFHGL